MEHWQNQLQEKKKNQALKPAEHLCCLYMQTSMQNLQLFNFIIVCRVAHQAEAYPRGATKGIFTPSWVGRF